MGRPDPRSPTPDGDQTAIDPDLLGRAGGGDRRSSSRPPVRTDEAAHRLHRADALRRVAGDIGSRLDLDRILAGLVDHAMVLFNGDRGRRLPPCPRRPGDGRGQPRPVGPLPRVGRSTSRSGRCRRSRSPRAGRCSPTDYRDDPRAGDVRAAVVQEGFDTICTAPLFDWTSRSACSTSTTTRRTTGRPTSSTRWPPSPSRPRSRSRTPRTTSRWRPGPPSSSRSSSSARACRGSTTSARSASRSRPSCASSSTTTTSGSTGSRGDDLIPVAMQGQVGEYVDETPEQLRVQFGQGITGWVAEHRIAQNLPDAAARPAREHDPRHRGRPRRVDAPRADDLRGPGPRRPRPLQARPPPVQPRTTCGCS